MKKSLLTLSFVFAVSAAFCQNETKSTDVKDAGNNEIKVNLLGSILSMPEITYERLFKDNTGLGISAFIGADDDVDYKFGVIPHFRVYFGNKKANGFFIEANAAIMEVDSYESYYIDDNSSYYYGTSRNNRTTATFGLGAAAGGKFLTKNGFVGEIFGGLGRFFGKNNEVEAYPRVGFVIGKRF